MVMRLCSKLIFILTALMSAAAFAGPVVTPVAAAGWFVPLGDRPVIRPGELGEADALGVSDPDILWDGVYFRLYYTVMGADGVRRIALAVSADLGRWLLMGVVFEPLGDGFDRDGVFAPSVVQRNGSYELYYTGERDGVVAVGRVVSPDGVDFGVSPDGRVMLLGGSGDPGRFDHLGVSDPSVVVIGDVLLLAYQGHDDRVFRRVGIAYSVGGGPFERYGDGPFGELLGPGPHGFDDAGALQPFIQVSGDRLRLFYTSLHY